MSNPPFDPEVEAGRYRQLIAQQTLRSPIPTDADWERRRLTDLSEYGGLPPRPPFQSAPHLPTPYVHLSLHGKIQAAAKVAAGDPYSCYFCPLRFIAREGLEAHYLLQHRKSWHTRGLCDVQGAPCYGYKFVTFKSMQDHLATRHFIYLCALCGTEERWEDDIKRHKLGCTGAPEGHWTEEVIRRYTRYED